MNQSRCDRRDTGLSWLARLGRLRALSLGYTNVTAEGLRCLTQPLPPVAMPSAAVGEDGEDEAVDSRWDFDGGGGGGAGGGAGSGLRSSALTHLVRPQDSSPAAQYSSCCWSPASRGTLFRCWDGPLTCIGFVLWLGPCRASTIARSPRPRQPTSGRCSRTSASGCDQDVCVGAGGGL